MPAAGKQTRSKQTHTGPARVRELVERHRDLRESIETAIAELKKGRAHVALNVLEHTRHHDTRKRR